MNNEMLEAIRTADEYIGNLKVAIEKVSEKMYSGDEGEGFRLVPNIADGLEYIYKIVILTNNVSGKIENIDILNEKFEEIVNAIEDEDIILVGDLFNYEILPIIEDVEVAFKEVLAN